MLNIYHAFKKSDFSDIIKIKRCRTCTNNENGHLNFFNIYINIIEKKLCNIKECKVRIY